MSLAADIQAAMARAQADGRHPHHVSLTKADWAVSGLPHITVKPAPDARGSVLWAMDAKGFKLCPYPVGD